MGLLKTPIFLLIFLLASYKLGAQDRLPLSHSEYIPSISSRLNPALSADPKVFMSLHIAGVSAFAHNDLAFFEGKRFGLVDLFKGRLGDADENLSSDAKNGNMTLTMDGPAVFVALGRSTWGLSTRFRTHFNAVDVAPELSRFVFHGFRFFTQYDRDYKADGSSMSAMTWGELQLNWAHMIRVTAKDHVNLGIGVKRLYGTGHLGLHIDQMDYLVNAQDIYIRDFTGSYAISDFGFKGGNGWGADIGLLYKKTIKGRKDYIPFSQEARCVKSQYEYLIGISVNDLGGVRFKEEAFITHTQQADVVWTNYIDTQVSNLETLDSLLQARIENDQNDTHRDREYRVSLPRSVNIHGDYNFQNGFHASAAYMIPWHGNKDFDLKRLSSMSITARYVRTRFELGLPLSLIDYDTFRAGIGLRFHYLYLGSDDLLRLFDGEDVYGTDFYVGLHMPIYGNKKCGGLNRKRGKLISPCWGQ